MKYNGKIGSCSNSVLRIGGSGSHYVYIKRSKRRNKYNVHTITSIENNSLTSKHTIPITMSDGSTKFIDPNKIRAIRNGTLYPIPKYHSNLPKWSGITHKAIKNIDKSDITLTRYKISNRHKFIVGKTYK